MGTGNVDDMMSGGRGPIMSRARCSSVLCTLGCDSETRHNENLFFLALLHDHPFLRPQTTFLSFFFSKASVNGKYHQLQLIWCFCEDRLATTS